MKCEWVKENITLHVYDELADDARYELEQHVARCAECAQELKGAREFRALMQEPAAEPDANLLAASRMKLQEGLEAVVQGGFWSKWALDPAVWLRQVRFSPALASAILLAGFAGGVGATYSALPGMRVGLGSGANGSAPAEAAISGIRSIAQEPGSDRVSIKYDTVSTQETQGSLNDQRIQQLLLFAARNNYSSGVRMDSVNLLTRTPNNNDWRVREALIYALRYDSNPGVRLKSLDALGTYVKEDVSVRDAVVQTLVNDTNSGIRTEALHLLEPVKADSSVRAVLMTLAAKDQSPYIRKQSRELLAQSGDMD